MSSRPTSVLRSTTKSPASLDGPLPSIGEQRDRTAAHVEGVSLKKSALTPIPRCNSPQEIKLSHGAKSDVLNGVPFIMAYSGPGNLSPQDSYRHQTPLSTSTRMSPMDRKDISFISDKPGHGRIASKGDYADDGIPPTMIPPEHHIIDKTMFPPSDTDYKYEYDEKERVWKATVFPGFRPSSRKEVLLLDKWLNDRLADNMARNKDPSDIVREAQFLYSASFNEIVRQVSVHCQERGKLLSKIWNRYIQLFEIVMELRDQEKNQFAERLAASESSIQNMKMEYENQIITLQLQFQSERRVLLHQQQRLEQHLSRVSQECTSYVESEKNLKIKLKSVVNLLMQKKEQEKKEAIAEESEQDLVPSNSKDDMTSPEMKRRASNIFSEIPASSKTSKQRDVKGQLREMLSDWASKAAFQSQQSYGQMIASSPLTERRAAQGKKDQGPFSKTSMVENTFVYEPSSSAPSKITLGGVAVPDRWMKYLRSVPMDTPSAQVLSEDWLHSFINYMYHKIIDDVLATYPWVVKAPPKLGGSPTKSHIPESKEISTEHVPPVLKYSRMTLSEMIYTYYLQLYGLRTTAELRLLDLVHTLMQSNDASKCPRTHLFSRFAGIYDELSRDALDFYLYASAVTSVFLGKITHPGSSDSFQPLCFTKDEDHKIHLNAIVESLPKILHFLPADSIIEFQGTIEKMSHLDESKTKREVQVHPFLTMVVEKWIAHNNSILSQFEKSIRSSLTGLVSYDSFIVGVHRIDPSKAKTDVLYMFRDAIMASEDPGDSLRHPVVEEVLRRNGLLKDQSVGNIFEMVKDQSKTLLKSVEFNFLVENWNAYFALVEDTTDDLLQKKIISVQVHSELHDQMKFMSKLISSEADPALVLSSFRLLLVRLFQFVY